MLDLEQRLAAVIATHMGCGCDSYRETLERAERAASAVILAVGLVQEFASTNGATQTVRDEETARRFAATWPERFGVATRHVTQWSDVSGDRL